MIEMKDLAVVDGHSDYPIQVLRERGRGNRRVIETQHLPEVGAAGVGLEMSIVGQDVVFGTIDWRDPSTLDNLDKFLNQCVHRTVVSIRF